MQLSQSVLRQSFNRIFGGLDAIQEKEKELDTSSNNTTSSLSQDEEIAEWEEPIWFDDNQVPSFPAYLFPEWIREYVEEFSERVQVPVDAPCMASLSVLSAALAKKYVVSLPEHCWKEPINLYTATIMPPGEKKSETLRVLTAPMNAFETEETERIRPLYQQQQEERDAKQKRIEQLKAVYAKKHDASALEEAILLRLELEREDVISLPRFNTTDCTAEKLSGLMQQNGERMAIITAEGGIFQIMAGRYSSGMLNLDIFLNSYSGDPTSVDRQTRSEHLQEPALTFGLFVQPDVIANLPKGFGGRGLLGRFLYSQPNSKVGYRKLEASGVNPKLKERYDKNMIRLFQLKQHNKQLFLSSEAYCIFKQFWERTEMSLRDEGELSRETLAYWGAKLSGTMLRVAALVHIAECIGQNMITDTIQANTMQKVVAAGEYFTAHAKAVFDCMSVDEELENAKYLIKLLQSKAGSQYTKQEVWQRTKVKIVKADKLDKALQILLERNYIKLQEKATGGRKKQLIVMNPTPKSTKSFDQHDQRITSSTFSTVSQAIKPAVSQEPLSDSSNEEIVSLEQSDDFDEHGDGYL